MEHPELCKRLEMLEFLHQALEEPRSRREPGLVLELHNTPPHDEGLESYNTLPSYDDSPRLTAFGTRVDVAGELGLGSAEALHLLKDLQRWS